MSIRRLVPLLLTVAILLAGCAGATPAATVVPTATNVPTVAATATALPAATLAAAPTATALPAPTVEAIATPADHDLIPADQLNDQTQARLRLAHLVTGGPNVDLIVNGAVVVIGGRPQVNIPASYINAYVHLMPGTYRIAVVPTGQTLAQAIIGPLDVPVVAGHRYTLAMMGQATDKSLKPLVIDETAAELKAGAVATDSVRIWVNNLAGGTGIDIQKGGRAGDTQVAYGDAVAAVYPVGNTSYLVKLTGIDSAYPNYDQSENLPGTSVLAAFVGTWGKDSDELDSAPTSELNVIDFLHGFSDRGFSPDDPGTFNTLLAAIKTAGLTDMLSSGGPFYFLAPTDAAFAALPGKQRNALLADPAAVSKLLRSLIAAQYISSVAKTFGGDSGRSMTNLLGETLTIGPGYTINGADFGDLNAYFVTKGSYVKILSGVPLLADLSLVPATPSPLPAVALSGTLPMTETGRIVYEAGAGDDTDSHMELYSIKPDGSDQIRLTNNQASDFDADVSPDGKRIVFVSNRDGNEEIYVMNADGSGQTRLTNNPNSDRDPRWSPDGKQIAFDSVRDGNNEIYLMNADGSHTTRLTNNPTVDAGPSWSPDGKKIAFTSDRSGNFEVYVMNVDGSGLINLTNNPANEWDPAWSPNGQQIAFNSDRLDKGEVFVMHADGSGQTDLTNSPGYDWHPSWSPDGAYIAFSTERDGGAETYIMRADGSRQAALTHDPSTWAYLPSWGK